MTTFFVGVYWGAREEFRSGCAERISNFLQRIALVDPAYAAWFKKVRNPKDASTAISSSPVELKSLLKSNRRDATGEAMTEIGFSFSAWTGPNKDPSASISVTCGGYSPKILNSAVISFAPGSNPSNHVLHAILNELVASFDPDNGLATSVEAMNSNTHLPVWQSPALWIYRREVSGH